MKDVLISIIVPAYNIELYIARCLDSILAQKYKKIEIIVVDDGSTDRTGKIIDHYASLDSRIIPIHKDNGGVTSARIEGIKKALGEYLGFVDGDDYIEPDMFERLLDNAIKYGCDISHCGYQMIFPNHIEYYYNTGRIVQQDKISGLKELLSGSFVEPGLWNKLYHKKLFQSLIDDNIMPLDIRINEDILMNYWLFKAAESAVFEDFCPYHYILRKDSAATSSLNLHKLKDPMRVIKIIQQDSVRIPEVNRIVEERLTRQLISIATLSVRKHGKIVKSFRKKIRNELRKKLTSILLNSYISKSIKLRAVWVCLFPNSYRWIHTLYARITGLDKKYSIE